MENLFTTKELDMMDHYRRIYGPRVDSKALREPKPIEYILRNWKDAKSEYLFKMFDNQLILSKEIEFVAGETEQWEKMAEIFYPGNGGKQFQQNFIEFLHKAFDPNLGHKHLNYDYWSWLGLLDIGRLINNRWSCDYTLEATTPDGKIIKITQDAKLTKALGKLAEAFNIQGFEEFRLAHSRVLNQKKLKGTLCLSIHPMDYMTMSDNNSDWSSCMSWKEDGCYRQGTVEMMNSEMVVVAYMTGSKNMDIFNSYFTWNNKKWRELFIITKDCISGVLDYPYHNDSLEEMCIMWLKELAENNLKWTYENKITDYPWSDADRLHSAEGKSFTLYTSTNMMYNDFCHDDKIYKILVDKNLNDGCEIELNYSGISECMWCGDTYDGYEGAVTCEDCNTTYKCDSCGEYLDLNNDAYKEIGDYYYCEHCIPDLPICPHCKKPMSLHEHYTVSIFKDEENEIWSHNFHYWCYNEFDNSRSGYFINYMENIRPFWDNGLKIPYSNLTEKGKEYFRSLGAQFDF